MAAPATLNQAGFAKLAGVSRKTVTKWKSQGFLIFTDGGEVDVERSKAVLRDRGFGNFGDPGNGVTRAPSGVTHDGGEDGNCQVTPDEAAAAIMAAAGFSLMSHADAERLKENYLALKNRLAFEQAAGRLVDRAAVEVKTAERWSAERIAWENRPSAVAAILGAKHGIDPVVMRIVLEEFVEDHLRDRVTAEEKRRVKES